MTCTRTMSLILSSTSTLAHSADVWYRTQELPESMGYGTAQGMLPGGMSSWLPPSTMDTSMDSIRRPPAA